MGHTTDQVAFVRTHRQRILEELKQFIRFPTVSTQPKHAGDLKRCANWLAQHLRQIGLQKIHVFATERHPIVYGEWLRAGSRPTVLIYGHYDVQPAEPLDHWQSPPFEPAVRGNNIYGRGACDDKGQMFTHLKAVEAYLRTDRSLPVNVKCLFEGEEEIGSPNLVPFIVRNARALVADVAVMSDMPMLGPNQPAITYAMRGGLSMEIQLRGTRTDLHSGIFGGAIPNPLQVLCEILAKLHDHSGRITIPNFYDRVRIWPAAERNSMAQSGPKDAKILADAGAKGAWGERAFSLYERTTIRPSLTITGITGGYGGPGVKAIIPARASAKLNFRLVPDQQPGEIESLVREHLAQLTPPTVELKTQTHLEADPMVIDRQHSMMRAAERAYAQSFGVEPVFLRCGGTIPVVGVFRKLLDIPTVLMGFASPDDRMHAPNEKFYLPNLYRGIETSIRFLSEVASLQRVAKQGFAQKSKIDVGPVSTTCGSGWVDDPSCEIPIDFESR